MDRTFTLPLPDDGWADFFVQSMAKEKSLETQYRDEAIYIIYCNRTEYFYVDIDSLIRLWERLIGYYENGKYTDAETNS